MLSWSNPPFTTSRKGFCIQLLAYCLLYQAPTLQNWPIWQVMDYISLPEIGHGPISEGTFLSKVNDSSMEWISNSLTRKSTFHKLPHTRKLSQNPIPLDAWPATLILVSGVPPIRRVLLPLVSSSSIPATLAPRFY